MAENQQAESSRPAPSRTAEVLSRLAALVRRPAVGLPLFALLAVGALGLGYYWHRYKNASLTVVNLRPCKTVFAVHRTTTEGQSLIEGWWELEAGQKLSLDRQFVGVEPEFSVYAESRCPELVRWVYELPETHPGTVYFEGGPGDTVSYFYVQPEAQAEAQAAAQPVAQPAGQPDAKDDPRRVAVLEVSARDWVEAVPQGGTELVGFVKVPSGGSSEFMHLITESAFAGIYDERGLPESGGDEAKIEVFAARAALLATSLERQRRFDQTWPDPVKSFPYYLGLEVEDHNGMDVPGVLIKEVVFEKSIYGDDTPFQAGDILQEFGGQTIFSGLDLHMLLYEHAVSLEKGIEVPVEFKLLRGEQVLAGKTLYFFNPAYWGRQDKLKAAGVGALNTVAFGGGAAAEALGWKAARGIGKLFKWATGDKTPDAPAPEYKQERWEIAQRNARLQQLEPGAYEVGSLAGLVAPSAPRLLFQKALTRSIARRGIPKLAAVIAASATLEVAEGVMWTVGDASPLRTSEQIVEDVKRLAPYAAGIGVVSGALTHRAGRR
ncbi:MAG TPA: hypothetical protein VF588_11120 [Pyrinomonadaceae bacterium]|jgi:hypothetical protein